MSENARKRPKGFSKEFDSWADGNVRLFRPPVTSGQRQLFRGDRHTVKKPSRMRKEFRFIPEGSPADKSPEDA
jgi:hypothetical protein